MSEKHLDLQGLGLNEDWEGNNAAFQCPVCKKVFIVSAGIHVGPGGEKGWRKCPACAKSIGHVSGGKKSGGTAKIEW
jgi:hypothetical protein